jgi:hypothetical protein
MVKVNLAGITVGEYDALPRGLYNCRVTSFVEKTSKGGKPMVEWQFTVTEGELKGRKIWLNNTLTKESLWAYKRTLLAVGFTEEQLEGDVEIEADEVLEQECVIRTDQESYNGKMQTRVVGLYAPGTIPDEATAGGVDELDIPFE